MSTVEQVSPVFQNENAKVKQLMSITAYVFLSVILLRVKIFSQYLIGQKPLKMSEMDVSEGGNDYSNDLRKLFGGFLSYLLKKTIVGDRW